MCMRTNILLNDDLVKEARRYSTARTKRGLIEEALTTYIAVKTDEQQRLTYETRAQQLDRKLAGLTLRERPLAVLKADRERI